MTPRVIDLAETSLRLPAHPKLVRDTLAANPAPDHETRYDYATLFYDCVWDEAQQAICLICPRLLNFEPLLRAATITLDGKTAKISAIQPLARGQMVVIPAQDRPKRLKIAHPLFFGTVPVGTQTLDQFAGRNVVFAISKNNRLDWITDWLTYYVAEHGCDAVALIDNGSTDYDMRALGKAMAVPGIAEGAILRADFPFGPTSSAMSKYLHMTMVHVLRQRLIGQARAALAVDIDELIYSASGHSVFDATVAAPEGYLRFAGTWVYADGGSRHADHRFVLERDVRVPRKYCVVPDGPQRDRVWYTHRIIARNDPVTPDFRFWHFRHVSTGWDYARDGLDQTRAVEDPHLVATMARVFGGLSE